MEKVSDQIFDYIAINYIGHDKNLEKIYEKIRKSFYSKEDEEEFFGILSELVYHEQLSAFKSGIKTTIKLFYEIGIA